MDFIADEDRSSGQALPAVLKERVAFTLRHQLAAGGTDAEGTRGTDTTRSYLHPTPRVRELARNLDTNRVFSARELDEQMWLTSQAFIEVQKQIARGEEIYFEETQGHGSNVFKGFDGFVDARDVGGSGSGSGGSGGGGSSLSSRRMPADYRWFSSSSTNTTIARHLKPACFGSSFTAENSKVDIVRVTPKEMEEHAKKVEQAKIELAERPLVPLKRMREAVKDDPELPSAKERKIDTSASTDQDTDKGTPEPKTTGKSKGSSSKGTSSARRTTRKRKAG